MAGEALRKELNCSVCLEIYTDPKILQCFHVYCQKCLAKLVFRDQQDKLSLPCPICRQVTPIPPSGTASLPSAFQVNRILEILEEHDSDFDSSKQPQTIYCSEHGAREVKLFCETCEKFVCCKCVINDGKHHSRDYKEITESFEIYREQLEPSLKEMEKKLATITKVVPLLDRHCDKVLQQKAAIEANIQDYSKNLIKIINRRQDELLDKVSKITRKKLDSLAVQRDRAVILQAQLSSCVEFTRKSIEEDPQQHEVLVMKTDILKQVKELATPFQPDIDTPCTEAGVMFSVSAEPAAACNKLGRVYTLNSLDSSKCFAIGKGIEEAVVGEKAFAELILFNLKGAVCCSEVSESEIQVELIANLTGRRIHGSVDQILKGQFAVSYQPIVKGQHKLCIRVDGEHIRGSPFSVLVKLPIEKLGIPVTTLHGDLQGPTDIAVNRKREIVVTDHCAHSVSVFTQHGRQILSFGNHGTENGQFKELFGVTVDGEDNIVVSDLTNHRIQKFSSNGIFLKAVGLYGNGRLEFNQPYGIAYSPSNDKFYVCDSLNHRVQVLNSDLTFSKIFGKRGTGKGRFQRPICITTDSTGQVYVADYYSHQIQVFTSEGQFLRMFGKEVGTGRALDLPFGVAVDSNGFVYATEFYTHCISVFSQKGVFITSFGSKGERPGQLIYPYGIAVHDGGVLYVCDFGNHCIQVF